MTHLPSVTQLLSGRAGIQSQAAGFSTPKTMLYPASQERGYFLGGDTFTPTRGNEVLPEQKLLRGPYQEEVAPTTKDTDSFLLEYSVPPLGPGLSQRLFSKSQCGGPGVPPAPVPREPPAACCSPSGTHGQV